MAHLSLEGIEEIDRGGEFPDIVFSNHGENYYVQVKVGGPEKILEGAISAHGLTNAIVVVYPEEIRVRFASVDAKEWDNACLDMPADFLILSEVWDEDERISGTFRDILQRFRQKLDVFESSRNEVNRAIGLIKESIDDLFAALAKVDSKKLGDISAEVIVKFDLFMGILEEDSSDKEKANKYQQVATNLACYLLVNQIAFYFLYKKNAGKSDSELVELDENAPDIYQHLSKCYDQITTDNYEAIYFVNILPHLPKTEDMERVLREIVSRVKQIPHKSLKYDLYGKLFHQLIPEGIRKVIAAFYTKSIAAEILAHLTVDSWKDQILDPACGSGTLLVAAYRAKMARYEALMERSADVPKSEEIHAQFLRDDITGFDIMPFAIHLTGINLSSQNIQFKTNVLRTAILRDSLELSRHAKEIQEGFDIVPFKKMVKTTLEGWMPGSKKPKVRKGAMEVGGITPSLERVTFKLSLVDAVIMNPPFSDREKLPEEFRTRLASYTSLRERCGNSVNLWGYFLALAHDLLRPMGKISGVIPINLFRGAATQAIRDFIFQHYTPLVIIKSVAERAFSEDSAFKDVLVIFKKKETDTTDRTQVVFLKKRLDTLSFFDAIKIEVTLRSLPKDGKLSNDLIGVLTVPSTDFLNNRINMMPLIHGTSFEIKVAIDSFWARIELVGGELLEAFNEDHLAEGIGLRPKGINECVSVTRSSDPSRRRSAKLVLTGEESGLIKFQRKGDEKTDYEVDQTKANLFLRTFTGLRNIGIDDQLDYIIPEPFPQLPQLVALSNVERKAGKEPLRIVKEQMKIMRDKYEVIKCHLAIPDKLDLTSPNTYLLSFFSEKLFAPNNMGYAVNLEYTDLDDYRIQALYFNSIILLVQFLRYKSETLGILRVKKADWNEIKILNIARLTKIQRKLLLDLYTELFNIDFPALIEQLELNFTSRFKLDSTFLGILGVSTEEIKDLLTKVYSAVAQELKNFKGTLQLRGEASQL